MKAVPSARKVEDAKAPDAARKMKEAGVKPGNGEESTPWAGPDIQSLSP